MSAEKIEFKQMKRRGFSRTEIKEIISTCPFANRLRSAHLKSCDRATSKEQYYKLYPYQNQLRELLFAETEKVLKDTYRKYQNLEINQNASNFFLQKIVTQFILRKNRKLLKVVGARIKLHWRTAIA